MTHKVGWGELWLTIASCSLLQPKLEKFRRMIPSRTVLVSQIQFCCSVPVADSVVKAVVVLPHLLFTRQSSEQESYGKEGKPSVKRGLLFEKWSLIVWITGCKNLEMLEFRGIGTDRPDQWPLNRTQKSLFWGKEVARAVDSLPLHKQSSSNWFVLCCVLLHPDYKMELCANFSQPIGAT